MSTVEAILNSFPDLPVDHIIDGKSLPERVDMQFDIAIIGSGTGGMVSAWTLARAGFKVIVLEEGGWLDDGQFPKTENDAYLSMYRHGALPSAEHHTVRIFQGQTVGGGSSISWTTCARTPLDVLQFWREKLSLGDLSASEMERWFKQIEAQLDIAPWTAAHNANNQVLADGAAKLGWETQGVLRHVHDCKQLGRCGLSCTVAASRGVLPTMLPEALMSGAKLITHVHVRRLLLRDGKVYALKAVVLDEFGKPTGQKLKIVARHFIVAAGTIQTPALLLRSQFPDPYRRLGRRVFLQPACFSLAKMPHKIEAWRGVPQSLVYHSETEEDMSQRLSFSVRAFPLYPVFAAWHALGHGEQHANLMRDLPYLNCLAGTLRDGFVSKRWGGRVKLRGDGHADLSYLLRPSMWEAIFRAWSAMASIQFAAGAEAVLPLHESAQWSENFADFETSMLQFPKLPELVRLSSWSGVGGCAMASSPKDGVVSSLGRHWQIANVSIFDASILPTSLSVPPLLTIAALALRNATHLAFQLYELAPNLNADQWTPDP